MPYSPTEAETLLERLEIKKSELEIQISQIRDNIGVILSLRDKVEFDRKPDNSFKFDKDTGEKLTKIIIATDRDTGSAITKTRRDEIYDLRKPKIEALLNG